MSAVHSRTWVPRTRVAGADLLVVAVPTLVGALLCALELNTRSLWLDEGATLAIASQHGAALWHGIAHDGGNMLLYYLLIHVVIGLFGDALWVVRLPSLFADAVTGGLVAALGLRLLGDRRQAVAGGLLTVISLPLVFWGQDARGYALMVTLATASMLAFVVILEGSAARGEAAPSPAGAPLRGAPVAYVLTTLAALYVGYDAALLVLAQLALLPLFRERAKLLLGCLAAVAILSIPLLVLAVERGSGQLFWVPRLSGSVLGQTALTLLSAGMPPNFHHTQTSVIAGALSGVLVIVALGLVVREVRRSADARTNWRLLLLAAWLVVPAVLGLAAAAVGKPIELARCAILLIPALSLLFAWVLCRPALPRAAGLAVFLVVLALRVLQIAPSYGTSPENWKAATAYVLSITHGQPACVAFYPQDGREPFDYYLRRESAGAARALTPVLPALPWGTVKPFVERYDTLDGGRLATITGRCSELVLLASHAGQSTGPAISRAHLAAYRQLRGALARRYPHQSRRKFGWAATVYVTRYWR